MQSRRLIHVLRDKSVLFSVSKCMSPPSVIQQRSITNQPKREKKEKIKIRAEPPKDVKRDWVGPPDPSSNIRPIQYYIPENESPLEKSYREKREEIWRWNHEFWENHNKSFFRQKKEFVTKGLEEKVKKFEGEGDPPQTLSAEEMAVFYKQFLNENYKAHLRYNKDWYKKNISLLWPAMRISVGKLWKKGRQLKKY